MALALTTGHYCVVLFELPFTDKTYQLPSWMWGLYPILALLFASVSASGLWIILGLRRFRIHGTVK
jgi:hypothetical protein